MSIDRPLAGCSITQVNVLRKRSWTSYSSSYVKMSIDLGKKLEEEKVSNVLIAFFSEYPKFRGNLNTQSKK